jgi:hypothetical protein
VLSNLSTFNSNAIFGHLADDIDKAKALGAISWTALGETFAVAVLGLAILLLALRFKTPYRTGFCVIGVALIIRAVIFYNPMAWYFFFKLYEPEEVGFKEKSVIAYQINKFFFKKNPKFLVIGSSQIALFKNYAQSHEGFSFHQFAAMAPIEYMLYKGLVEDENPSNVILYLSEFDLARAPTLTSIELDPISLQSVRPLYFELLHFYGSNMALRTVEHMLVGELLPEYKHRYLLRAGVSNWLTLKQHNQNISEKVDWTHQQAYELRSKLNEEFIDYNIQLLEQYISFCEKRGTHVYVFEGRYNPIAYDDHLLKLKAKSSRVLNLLASRHTNMSFVETNRQPALYEQDYVDGYHLSAQASDNIAAALMSLIEKENKNIMESPAEN